MVKREASGIILMLLSIGVLSATLNLRSVNAWSNGGYSIDPQNPAYGTHDWIAQHALDWLPENETQYILDNLAAYLYGTELPDNGRAPDGIGDTVKHHVYFNESGMLIDDSAAFRAQWESERVLSFLNLGDFANASKTAGIMSHYLADVAVFGHVMATNAPWGAETHHADYEAYVNERTNNYTDEFNSYLSFDGNLDIISAYNATKNLAYDTTFDADGDLTCVWMDQNYNWSDPAFKNRAGESLNLAVNYLADVLHTLYVESSEEEKFYAFPVNDVGLIFENVTAEGLTTVNETETGPEPPPMCVVKKYYNIETTANYSDKIQVKIVYGGNLTAEEEASMQLMRWNETTQQWVSVTTCINVSVNLGDEGCDKGPTTYLVVGETSHLSIYGVTCTSTRKATPTTIVVPDDYPTIQEAINHANNGDTIFVKHATYNENVVINKTVQLIGENRETTIISGSNGDLVMVNATGVTFTNFSVQSSEEFFSPTAVFLSGTSGTAIANTTIRIPFGQRGIYLNNSFNNIIAGNNISCGGGFGILITNSSHNRFYDNYVAGGLTTISNEYSDHNVFLRNSITNSTEYVWPDQDGMGIYDSLNLTLKDNVLFGNKYNFGVFGDDLSYYFHSIDTSNVVNGKPIYYLINQQNLTIDPLTFPNVGYLGIVNSRNIRVENLSLRDNVDGLLLAFVRNSSVVNNTVANNGDGIYLFLCFNVTLSENTIENNYYGVVLFGSSGNTLEHSIILNSFDFGLDLTFSSNNTLVCNNVVINPYPGVPYPWQIAICLYYSFVNIIVHNNFINYTSQVGSAYSYNVWDLGYPYGGNYWSNYNGTDADHDGIGDTPYVIDAGNIDRYPLMHPWTTIGPKGPGDVNGDGKVDIFDVVSAATAYGSVQGSLNWNPNADLAPPYGIINILDLVTIVYHYGQKYP